MPQLNCLFLSPTYANWVRGLVGLTGLGRARPPWSEGFFGIVLHKRWAPAAVPGMSIIGALDDRRSSRIGGRRPAGAHGAKNTVYGGMHATKGAAQPSPELLELARTAKSKQVLANAIDANNDLLSECLASPVAKAAMVRERGHDRMLTRAVTDYAAWLFVQVGREREARNRAKVRLADDDSPQGRACLVEGQDGYHEIPGATLSRKRPALSEADQTERVKDMLFDLNLALAEWAKRTGQPVGLEIRALLCGAADPVLQEKVRWENRALPRRKRLQGVPTVDPRSRQMAGAYAAVLEGRGVRDRQVQQAVLTLLLGPRGDRPHRRPSWFVSHYHGDWATFSPAEWRDNGSAWLKLFARLDEPMPRGPRDRALASLVASAAQPNPEKELTL